MFKFTSTKIGSGSSVSDISMEMSKISLEDKPKVVISQEKNEITPKDTSTQEPLRNRCLKEETVSSNRSRKQQFHLSENNEFLKTEQPEYEEFMETDIPFNEMNANPRRHESWLQDLQKARGETHWDNQSEIVVEPAVSSSSSEGEQENLKVDDNVKIVDKSNEELDIQMNKFLKAVPASFSFNIPHKDFNEVCFRADTEIQGDSVKDKVTVKKLVFVPKTGHNLISNYFKQINPYCTLSFYLKKLKQDFEMTKRSNSQISLYCNCLNSACTGRFCFSISKVPRKEKQVLVNVK